MPIDPSMVKWDDAPTSAPAIDPRMVKWQDVPQQSYSPTDGMSTFDKLAAGAGKAIYDLGRGAGQWVGLVDRKDVEESRQRDAALMNTTAGKVGNIGGSIAALVPAAFVPGVNTLAGATALGAVTGALQPSTSNSETASNIGLGAAGGLAGQVAGNLISKGANKLLANRQAAFATKEAADAQRMAAARAGNELGYVIPPADLQPGTSTELLSGLSGKIKTAQVASQRNQQVTNALARKAIGLDETSPLNADVVQGLKQEAGKAYDTLRKSGTIVADEQFVDDLIRAASENQNAAAGFPVLGKKSVNDLADGMLQPKFDASQAVDAIKTLRNDASASFRSGDTALARTQKEIATALENQLGRHLEQAGNPEALAAFRTARQQYAKVSTVQKALNTSTGDVSAPVLAAQLKKGAPLSGDLKAAAEIATAFPKATQMLKEAPKATSPLDWAVAGMSSLHNPAGLLTLGARPAARSLLLSPMYQRSALQQLAAPTGGLLGLGGNTAGLLGAPAGAVGLLYGVQQ